MGKIILLLIIIFVIVFVGRTVYQLGQAEVKKEPAKPPVPGEPSYVEWRIEVIKKEIEEILKKTPEDIEKNKAELQDLNKRLDRMLELKEKLS